MRYDWETYHCDKKEYARNMGGWDCYDGRAQFYLDKRNQVKVGDKVELLRDDNGFYKEMKINGVGKKP